MALIRPIFLLFTLNLLDAVLTIVWVRHGIAIESNQLMAGLLDLGNLPFLTVKLAMGTVTALVLFSGGDRKLARVGVNLALAVYVGLMGIHIFTGVTAMGLLSENNLHNFLNWTGQIVAAIV